MTKLGFSGLWVAHTAFSCWLVRKPYQPTKPVLHSVLLTPNPCRFACGQRLQSIGWELILIDMWGEVLGGVDEWWVPAKSISLTSKFLLNLRVMGPPQQTFWETREFIPDWHKTDFSWQVEGLPKIWFGESLWLYCWVHSCAEQVWKRPVVPEFDWFSHSSVLKSDSQAPSMSIMIQWVLDEVPASTSYINYFRWSDGLGTIKLAQIFSTGDGRPFYFGERKMVRAFFFPWKEFLHYREWTQWPSRWSSSYK